MKILLLNMPVAFNKWQNLEMPLGISYIASELEKDGYEVKIIDYEVESFSAKDFRRRVLNFAPQVVGISFRTASYSSAKKVALLIKEIDAGIKTILGGHHATAFPEQTLQELEADFLVRGEGEYTVPALLKAISSGESFQDIKGLTYKNNERIINNDPRAPLEDLDTLSFPAWHLLPIDKYLTGSILTSRGCPFCCIYCDKNISTRIVRFRSPENIYREIREFEERYGKGRIYFVDDYLLLNKDRLKELLNLMIKDNDLKINWHCQSRVDGIDREILGLAKKSGCNLIIYGIETGDKTELDYINKRTTLEEALDAINYSREVGIKSRANFMVGFPISTEETITNSIRFAKKINADIYRFFVVSPLPNTTLWDTVIKMHPEIARIGWEKFDFYSASFDTLGVKKTTLFHSVWPPTTTH